LKRGHPPWQGEGRAFKVAKRAEVTRAADSPCTGPCTNWRPLLAGVGTRSVGPGGAGELIRQANSVELVRPREFALEGQRCADGGRAGLSTSASECLQNVAVQSGLGSLTAHGLVGPPGCQSTLPDVTLRSRLVHRATLRAFSGVKRMATTGAQIFPATRGGQPESP
jgi:hypothetical protein